MSPLKAACLGHPWLILCGVCWAEDVRVYKMVWGPAKPRTSTPRFILSYVCIPELTC